MSGIGENTGTSDYQARAEETIALLLRALKEYIALDNRRRADIRAKAADWRACWWAANLAIAATGRLAYDTERGAFSADKCNT